MRSPITYVFSAGAALLLAAGCAADDSGEADDAAAANGAAEDADEDATAEFTDNTVTIVVATGAGGGYDSEARLLQPALQDTLREMTGEDITVRVENMPGGEGRIGAQTVYSAGPDENLIWYYDVAITVAAQLEDEEAGNPVYDLGEFQPLGLWGGGAAAYVFPIGITDEQSIEALAELSQQEPILLGDVGYTEESLIMAGLLEEEGIDLNFDFVSADGTSDAVSLLLRGDIDGIFTTGAGVRPFVEDNSEEMEFWFSTSCETDEANPIPTMAEFGVPNAEEICQTQDFPRMFGVGPEMPTARADLLADALLSTLEDPDFQATVEDADRLVSPLDREVATQQVEAKLDVYRQFADLFTE